MDCPWICVLIPHQKADLASGDAFFRNMFKSDRSATEDFHSRFCVMPCVPAAEIGFTSLSLQIQRVLRRKTAIKRFRASFRLPRMPHDAVRHKFTTQIIRPNTNRISAPNQQFRTFWETRNWTWEARKRTFGYSSLYLLSCPPAFSITRISMSYKFVLINSESGIPEQNWVLPTPINVGRCPTSDITLEDSSISRRHCQFLIDPYGSLIVRDMGSTNGDYLACLPAGLSD